MATVAEQLRTAREAQNITINQIAEITNVRGDHIRAIEDGNYDVFSAPVYIKGFVRSYARILKLDVPKLIAELEAELRLTEKFSEPPPLTDEPRTLVDFVTLQLSKLNWGRVAIGLGVLFVLLLAFSVFKVLRNANSGDPAKGLPPGIYQPRTNARGNTLPLPSASSRR